MWKWVTKAGRLAATALLLSFLSVWTTGYIVNSYLEATLKQLGLPLEIQPPGLSGFWGNMWGAGPFAEADSEKESRGYFQEPHQPEMEAPADPAWTPELAFPEDIPERFNDSRDPAVMPESDSPGDVPVFGGGGSIQEITEDERETVRSILMQLNEEQLLQLSRLLENGWSESEWAAAEKLLKSELDDKDYNILMEILSRAVLLQNDPLYPVQDQAF